MHFLQGSELKRASLSIVVSNLVFSAVHVHIGLAFALLAFIPGLFWGWLFLRTNSWLGASLSHLFLGGAAIFLFGIEELLQKLALMDQRKMGTAAHPSIAGTPRNRTDVRRRAYSGEK